MLIDESTVKIIAQEIAEKYYSMLQQELQQLKEDTVRKETFDIKNQEINEMKADIKKIYAMFIAILTGIAIQLISTFLK